MLTGSRSVPFRGVKALLLAPLKVPPPHQAADSGFSWPGLGTSGSGQLGPPLPPSPTKGLVLQAQQTSNSVFEKQPTY